MFNKGAHGLPKKLRGANAPIGKALDWTGHAQRRANQKGVSRLAALPPHAELVEVEVNLKTRKPFKWVYRVVTSLDRIEVYVVKRDRTGCYSVLTCWVNNGSDKHDTLRIDKYENPRAYGF